MVIPEFQAHAVCDNRALAHGDVGKRAGMHQAGLIFGRAHEGGVDGVAHKGRHGISHFEITAGHRFAALVESHGDIVDALFQVGKIRGHGQDGHQLGAHGDAEFGLHGVAVGAAAQADDDVSERLGAEVDDPAHFHAGGVDVEAAHAGQAGQLLIVVVSFMLHAGGHGHHAQVVGVHDVVDVAGKSQGEFGHGDQQGVSAAGCGSFDVHGGAAGGLAQGTAHAFAPGAQAFHQAQRCGAFAFTQRSGGDGGHFDVFPVRFVFQTVDDFQKVDFGQPAHRQHFFGLESQLFSPRFRHGHVLFRFFGNLPVGHFGCIKSHFRFSLSLRG